MTDNDLSKYVECDLGTCSRKLFAVVDLVCLSWWSNDKREHRRNIFRRHSIQAFIHYETRMIKDPFGGMKATRVVWKAAQTAFNISCAVRFWSFTGRVWLAAAVLPHITQQKSNTGRNMHYNIAWASLDWHISTSPKTRSFIRVGLRLTLWHTSFIYCSQVTIDFNAQMLLCGNDFN